MTTLFKRYEHSKGSGTITHPCEKCKLYKKAITPRMPPTGKGKKGIWVHGEAPGAEEDKFAKQFHERGISGSLLRRKLSGFGVDLDEDCWKDNCLRCRPPDNRTPTDTEIKLCQTWIIPDLIDKKPSKIFLFGGPAIKSLITTRLKGLKFDGVKKWVGWRIPDQQLKAWLFPNWHPSYLNRSRDEKALWLKFDEFLENAIEHHSGFPDWPDPEDTVRIINNPLDASSLLSRLIQDKSPGAIDWETTGLKPHAEGHRIVTGAICTGRDKAWAFPMFEDRIFLSRLRRWLRDNGIEKYVHNRRMERSWSLNCLGVELGGVIWDSMQAAHVLDNRPGITGLKFQVYVRYGYLYGQNIKRFLAPTDGDSKKYGANAFNKIDQAPLDKLLLYNGMDALFTYWLCKDQMAETNPLGGKYRWAKEPCQLIFQGNMALTKIHESGIPVDEEYCEDQDGKLGERLQKVTKSLEDSDEMAKWERVVGKPLNPDSDPQLNRLFHRILKYKPLKTTVKGNPSVDKEVLENIGTPFSSNIIRFRQLNKLRNTYLGGFMRERVNGVMHPFFPTHLVSTFRGSSDSPNFTNIPKRDEQAKRITRRAIKPSPGRQLLDVDYARIEVCVGACNSRDPKLIEYVSDSTTDMHRDQAMEIFLLEKEQVVRPLRYAGKNQFVFPQFYGSWWKSCAPNLWTTAERTSLGDGMPVLEHLRDQGIKSYKKFEKHIEEVENQFWNVKFRAYRDWKEDNFKFYQRHGYIELPTGFRCYWSQKGLMNRKECMNYPNQGGAFHCLLWSMTRLDEIREDHGWKSKIIGQIHDDIVWDIVPEEKEEIYPIIRQVMCHDIRDYWDWIIVPLDIEAEISEVDGNWYEQKSEKI